MMRRSLHHSIPMGLFGGAAVGFTLGGQVGAVLGGLLGLYLGMVNEFGRSP
jgi:uncharacterized membrane protein